MLNLIVAIIINSYEKTKDSEIEVFHIFFLKIF